MSPEISSVDLSGSARCCGLPVRGNFRLRCRKKREEVGEGAAAGPPEQRQEWEEGMPPLPGLGLGLGVLPVLVGVLLS